MELPSSIREETLTVLGVDMRCHILSDGRRIIEASDVERLFQAMSALGMTGEEIDAVTSSAFQ